MRTIAGLLLTTLLMMSTDCAKTDWIDRTLVTVDVTGVWVGAAPVSAGGFGQVILELEQTGATVNGVLRFTGPSSSQSGGVTGGPIEGGRVPIGVEKRTGAFFRKIDHHLRAVLPD